MSANAPERLNGCIVIAGAGPAGVSAALEFSNHKTQSVIIEKNPSIGGLSRTLHFGPFSADIGPHRFFTKDEPVNHLIRELLRDRLILVNRLTSFVISGKFLRYPVQPADIMRSVPLGRLTVMLRDYICERLKGVFHKRPFNNFEEKIVSDFGRSLAELNMLNYSEKIWGMPCSQISVDWASQRIQDLSVARIISSYFRKGAKQPKSIVDQFLYPAKGTQTIYDTMLSRAAAACGTELFTSSQPVSIEHNGRKITSITVHNSNGQNYTLTEPAHLISSIPITELVALFKPALDENVLQAAAKLRFRSHVSLFLTLRKPSLFREQWLYFPDTLIPFGRIMEPKNFDPAMSPEGRTSLLIEFFCWENDPIWAAGADHLLAISMPWLEKLNILTPFDIIDSYVHREKYAYPVYDLTYRQERTAVFAHLKRFSNLTCIGRSGMFRYNNQDHAITMGIMAARSVVDGKERDIETVGTQNEYLEDGRITKAQII